MKDFFAKFISGQRGFSLVQTLVGAGIIGGLSLVAAQLTKQGTDNKLVADANYGIIDLTGRIQTLVSNNSSCTQSFTPYSVAPNGTVNISALKNTTGNDVYAVNGKYSENKVRINGMTFTRTAKNSVLSVTMEKLIAGKTNAPSLIKKDFFINAEWTGNTLASCASDITNFIDTVAAEALSQACPDAASTSAEGLVKDGDKCKANFQMRTDVNALRCPAEQTIVGLEWNSTTKIYKPVCKMIFAVNPNDPADVMPTCAVNEVLKRTGGKFVCVSLNCPVPGQVPTGMDLATGKMNCFGCSAGQYLVSTASGWTCANSMCVNSKNNSQEFFVGFSETGTAVCNKLIDATGQCSSGANLKVGADGKIALDCCTANCSNAANECSGVAFASSNSCGSCVGTKPADCSNASNFCVGTTNPAGNGCGTCPGTKPADCSNNGLVCNGLTYSSSNGCGTCTGSKAATNATWSPTWTATSTYQAKAGSTCSNTCGAGTQPAQRKYTRACNNDEDCGGSTCVGPSEEWRDEGTIACTGSTTCSTCTEGTTRLMATTQIGVSNTIYCGSADGHTGDKWTYGFERCVGGNWNRSNGLAFTRSQDICSNGKTTPPSNTPVIYKDDGIDPCNVTAEKAQMKVTSGYGTFDFCTFSWSSGGTTGTTTSGGGGGGCFVAGTQVTMADGALKNIEDILVGDKLIDGQNKVVTVKKLIPLNYAGEIYGINGGGYFFTPNHPFLTVEGWKSLDPQASLKETPGLKVTQLKVGDILIKRNGIEMILSLDSIPTREKVYNFELDGSHEYIADDYVVHNKQAPVDPGPTLP